MKLVYIIVSILLFLALFTGNIYFYKYKNRFIREKSVTIGTFLLFIYIVLSTIFVFKINTIYRAIFIICGLSPFIIGKFATYKRLQIYTAIQLLIIIIGIIITICYI